MHSIQSTHGRRITLNIALYKYLYRQSIKNNLSPVLSKFTLCKRLQQPNITMCACVFCYTKVTQTEAQCSSSRCISTRHSLYLTTMSICQGDSLYITMRSSSQGDSLYLTVRSSSQGDSLYLTMRSSCQWDNLYFTMRSSSQGESLYLTLRCSCAPRQPDEIAAVNDAKIQINGSLPPTNIGSNTLPLTLSTLSSRQLG